jgi:hypothetical protein
MAAIHDYLAKAHENLAAAESELQNSRTRGCLKRRILGIEPYGYIRHFVVVRRDAHAQPAPCIHQ